MKLSFAVVAFARAEHIRHVFVELYELLRLPSFRTFIWLSCQLFVDDRNTSLYSIWLKILWALARARQFNQSREVSDATAYQTPRFSPSFVLAHFTNSHYKSSRLSQQYRLRKYHSCTYLSRRRASSHAYSNSAPALDSILFRFTLRAES